MKSKNRCSLKIVLHSNIFCIDPGSVLVSVYECYCCTICCIYNSFNSEIPFSGWFAKDPNILRRVGHILLQAPFAMQRSPRQIVIADDCFQHINVPLDRSSQVVVKTTEKLFGSMSFFWVFFFFLFCSLIWSFLFQSLLKAIASLCVSLCLYHYFIHEIALH